MITIAVEGDTEDIGVRLLLEREFPGALVGPQPAVQVIVFRGNRQLLKEFSTTVRIEAAKVGDHVFALLDLKGLGGPREDPDQAVARHRRSLLDSVKPELQGRCSIHVLRHEIEAVYLTQPKLLKKKLGFPAESPLYEQPEKVNGENGVWKHLVDLARKTPGTRDPSKKTLARLLFKELDVELTREKMPSFYAFWQEVRERMIQQP